MDPDIYTKSLQKLEKAVPSNASPLDSPLGSMAWQVQSNYGQRERVPLPLGRQPHTRAHSSPWGPQLTEEYQVLATQERTVLGVPWKGTLLALAGNGAYIWKWQQ